MAVTPSTSRLPARYLPLYQPFVDLGDATGTSALIVPVTDFLSPFTQTIIETGYDRTNYANPQPGTILPPKTFNPIKTAVDLVNDIPEGINMALTPGRTPLPRSPPGQGPRVDHFVGHEHDEHDRLQVDDTEPGHTGYQAGHLRQARRERPRRVPMDRALIGRCRMR